MAWYRTGTVAVTNGSATITGAGTAWVANVAAGHGVVLPDGRVYEVLAVVSNTSITLGGPYLGGTASGQSYVIVPTRGPELALLQSVAAMIDTYGAALLSVGQGLFADGTVTAPGLRFSADQNTGVRRAGADAMALVTGGVDRFTVTNAGASLAGLLTGTAVTQSQTDTTGGRVTKVGDFGLGAVSAVPLLPDADSFVTPAGQYYTTSATANNASLPINPFGYMQVIRFNASVSTQIYTTLTNGALADQRAIFVRKSASGGGSWGAWYRLMDQSSIVGTVAQSGGMPTGAVIERGTNANGNYTRFADGTQECFNTLSASSGAGVVWTFPAAFSAAPVIGGMSVATVCSSVQMDAAPSATAATISARDKTDARRADVVHLVAKGRWF